LYDVVKFEFAKLPFILGMAKKMETFLLISSVPSGKSSLLLLDLADECHATARGLYSIGTREAGGELDVASVPYRGEKGLLS
jgi:hypothetical protein